MAGAYVPERGDVVWLTFDPQAGHEQAGRRLAIVVSPRAYNEKVGLALFCPLTARRKGYPYEIEIPRDLAISGVVLSDQLKSLDWRARKAEFICRLPGHATLELLAKTRTLTA